MKMLPNKKILKLSRGNSQSQTNKVSLDDSMDDFLMARPSKDRYKNNKDNPRIGQSSVTSAHTLIYRKTAKVLPASKLLNTASKSEYYKDNIIPEITASNDEDEEKGRADEQPSSSKSKPQESTEKKPRKPRKKAADESDLSLAIALSESLASANETARRKEEELLIKVLVNLFEWQFCASFENF